MLSKRQIKEMTARAYPCFTYSYGKRKKLRGILKNEIQSYSALHPDANSQEIEQLYCEDAATYEPAENRFHIHLPVLIFGLAAIVVCIFLILLATGQTPMTYVVK